MTFAIRPARFGDVPSWLELVREVEDLFGPMPAFADRAERAIRRGTAVVAAAGPFVHGAALLSQDDRPHHIHWLSVRATSRRNGIGAALMEAIVDRWPTGDIEVVTFRADNADGLPARRYYENFGFENRGATESGPDGTSRDVYVRRSRRPA